MNNKHEKTKASEENILITIRDGIMEAIGDSIWLVVIFILAIVASFVFPWVLFFLFIYGLYRLITKQEPWE